MEDGAGQDPILSAPGIVLGTAYAMSPEQALGRELDARSDLFSLGALLYEALTGILPFRGDSLTTSLARVLSYQPLPLRRSVPGLPRELSDLVERLLEKEPAQRPGSAREVVKILAALCGGGAGVPVAEPAGTASLAQESTVMTLDQTPPRRVAALQRETPRRPSSGSAHRRTLGERRLMTVVCCGLVELDDDSGEAGFLGLEALAETMAAFQELAGEVCERHRGQPGTALGHLLWLYFGYPRAHEDDVQRAVRAARELAARIGGLGARISPRGKRRLALRIAVHTGHAAVTSRAGQEEKLQLGSVLDLATSLQSAAPVGKVVVSGASLKLIERDFKTEALPPIHVPGVGAPVSVHRVLGEIEFRERGSGAAAPLVGREREIELLEDRFRLTCSGIGQAVMVVGEAGIGKSRLVQALRERLADRELVWWDVYGSASTQNSPLAPIIDLLDRMVSGSAEISPEGKLDRLAELLPESPAPESLPLLAHLLSLMPQGEHGPFDFSPEAQRKQTFDAVVALLAEVAERQVLVLLIEDLHWVDPSTLELLGLLLDEISALPMMLIATYRPELQLPSWGHLTRITQLGLSRLSQEQATALVDRLARGVPAEVRQQILARTDGVPLFIE
ncbi:MAG: AAA family ATPase, partial [Thermoanaerobaculia bacterium]